MRKLGLLMLMAALGLAGTAWGADAPIPANWKSEIDASSHKDDIAAKIKQQVDKLSNDEDPLGQTAAREWLVAEVLQNNNLSSTSASYIDIYTSALNNQLMALVKNGQATARVRVNAVLIAGRVSDASGSSDLMPTIEAALSNTNEAMVWEGEKAAGQIMVPVLKDLNVSAQQQKKFLETVVAGVKEHATGQLAGDIADDAYRALDPTVPDGIVLVPDAPSHLADAVIALQKARLKLYDSGWPESPISDSIGSLFLLDAGNWAMLTPEQKLAAMQNSVDLIAHAAQRAKDLPTNEAAELLRTVNNIGGCLDRLATSLGNPNAAGVMQVVERLQLGVTRAQIDAAVNPICDAARQLGPALKDLKQPGLLGPTTKKTH